MIYINGSLQDERSLQKDACFDVRGTEKEMKPSIKFELQNLKLDVIFLTA